MPEPNTTSAVVEFAWFSDKELLCFSLAFLGSAKLLKHVILSPTYFYPNLLTVPSFSLWAPNSKLWIMRESCMKYLLDAEWVKFYYAWEGVHFLCDNITSFPGLEAVLDSSQTRISQPAREGRIQVSYRVISCKSEWR